MKGAFNELFSRWRARCVELHTNQEHAQFQTYFTNSLRFVETNKKGIAYDLASIRHSSGQRNHRHGEYYSPKNANAGDFQKSFDHFVSYIETHKRRLAADMAHDHEDKVRAAKQQATNERDSVQTDLSRTWGGPEKTPHKRVSQWMEYAKAATISKIQSPSRDHPAILPE